MGNALWTKTYYGSPEPERGRSVQQTTDGGYIVLGEIQIGYPGYYDGYLYLLKTDANGDTLWTRYFGEGDGDWGYSVLQTTDGGYIVVGFTQSYATGSGDVWLIRTDANGDTLWTKTYGGSGFDIGYCIQKTIDNGYIISGYTTSFGSASAYLIKINSIGDTLWTKTYNDSSFAYIGRSVYQTSDGGFVMTVRIKESSPTDDYDVGLIRTDSNGDVLWIKKYGGNENDISYSVQQTNDRGYAITGVTYSFGAGYSDVYLIKTDSLGNTFTNIISGNIYEDANTNCSKDSTEDGLAEWVIKIGPSNRYASADSIGNYSVLVDTGTHTVSQVLSSKLWGQNCPASPNTYSVAIDSLYTTIDSVDFGNQIIFVLSTSLGRYFYFTVTEMYHDLSLDKLL